jgi:hypothetical protein
LQLNATASRLAVAILALRAVAGLALLTERLPIDVAGRRDEKSKLGAVLSEPESTVTNFATGQQEKVLRGLKTSTDVIIFFLG